MATSSTKYVRITTRIEVARDGTYNDLVHEPTNYVDEFQATRLQVFEVLATTSGVTLDLALFGAVKAVVIKNRDPSTGNFVVAKFRNSDNGAVDNEVAVLGGQTVSIGAHLTVASDLVLTADTADVECIVEVYGTV